MPDPRHDLGLRAETAVATWLERSGWAVLDRRVRTRTGGEVDIVAIDCRGVLVAIEVRARRSGRAGRPEETVSVGHVRRLRRSLASVAEAWGTTARELRIDLVTAEPVAGSPGRWMLRRHAGLTD